MPTYWVSPTGAASWASACGDAPLAGSSCASLATANANAVAGDVVYLRDGAYDRTLQPARSGVSGSPITFSAYGTETPTITVLDDAHGRWGLYLRLRNYIKVRGVKFSGCLAFYALYGSSYNEIAWCEFTTSGGFIYSTAIICDTNLGLETGGTPSNHNWVHHNKFTKYGAISNGNDLGTVRIGAGYRDTSTNNTFEDNEFSHGGHDLLDIGAPKSVVRRNIFHNEESYFADTGGATNTPSSGYFGNRCIILSNAGWTGWPGIPLHCLVESNRIGHSGTPPDDDGAFGIESAGYHTIIRFNDIYNTAGSGIYLKAQPDPSYYCSCDPDAPDPHGPGSVYKSGSYTRAYNNSLYHCGFGDADISPGFKYGVQVHGIVGATYYPPTGYCRKHPTHGYNFALDWPWPLSVVFKNNIVYDYKTGEYTFAASSAGQVTYDGNYHLDPGYVDTDISDPTSATLPDLRLNLGSPCAGAGVPLTRANGSGTNSTTLAVGDAWYFQDGSWGSSLSDIRPDWIAVGAATNRVEVESIDYDTNTITLATPISWADGAPVYIYKNSSGEVVMSGDAPAIGAHDAQQAPAPAVDLFVEPLSREVERGGVAVYAVRAASSGAGQTTLSVTGLPVGATATFSVNPFAANDGQAVLSIDTTGIVAGDYQLTLTGTE